MWAPVEWSRLPTPSTDRTRLIGKVRGYVGVPKPMTCDPEFSELQDLAVGYGMAKLGPQALDDYVSKCNRQIPELPSWMDDKFMRDAVDLAWSRLPWSGQVTPYRRFAPVCHEDALGQMKPESAPLFPFQDYQTKGNFLTAENQFKLDRNFLNTETSPVFTTTTFKVESLPNATIKRKGGRVLRPVNVDFLYKQIRLFLTGTKAHLNSDYPRHFVLGGFDEFHGGWDRMHAAFGGKAKVYGFDGKYYDSLWPDFIYRSVDLILMRAYDFGDAQPVYEYVMRNLRISLCLNKTGEIWEYRNTHCTGHYLTKVFNDLATHIYLAAAFLVGCRENACLERRFTLFSCVTAAVVGDDGLMKPGKETPWFEPLLIKRVVAQIGGVFEFEDDEPRVSTQLSFLSTATIVEEDSRERLPLHMTGKSVARLMHSKQTDRTPEMAYQRCYGVYMMCWPDKRVRVRLREKLLELRRRLPARSYCFKLDHSDAYMHWHYSSKESGPMVKYEAALKLSDAMVKTAAARKRQRQRRKERGMGGRRRSNVDKNGKPLPPKRRQRRPRNQKGTGGNVSVRGAKGSYQVAGVPRLTANVQNSLSFKRIAPLSTHNEKGCHLLPAFLQPSLDATATFGGSAMNTNTGVPITPVLPITPLSLGNNRLSTMASLFSEWRPRSMKIRYVPTTGSFANGNYIMTYMRDPSKIPLASATSTSYQPAFDLTIMSEQDKVVTGMISSAFEMDVVRPGEWGGEDWLVCSQTNFSGLVSRLSSAGNVQAAVLGLCQNQSSGDSLVGQTGQFWLEYDIDFRGNNDDAIARAFNQVYANLTLQSATTVTAGNPLNFSFRDATTGAAIEPGNEVIVVQLTTSLTTVAGGTVIGRNALVYLGLNSSTNFYNAYTTLADAIHQTSAGVINAAVTTTANIPAPVAFIMPISNTV